MTIEEAEEYLQTWSQGNGDTPEAAAADWNRRAGDEEDDMTARATIDRLVAEWDSIEKEELEKVIRKLGEMEDEK